MIKLPLELLSLIFELVDTISTKFNRCTLPGTLSLVCRHWWQAALATPRLWSFIPFRRYSRNLEDTRLRLERSRKRPLQIHITIPGIPFFEEEAISLFMDLIAPHIPRWESFYYQSLQSKHLMDLAKWCRHGHPLILKSISIKYIGATPFGDGPFGHLQRPSMSFPSACVKLQHLSIEGFGHLDGPLYTNALQTFHFVSGDWEGVGMVASNLLQSKNLQSMAFHVYGPLFDSVNFPAIEMPQLRDLSVSTTDCAEKWLSSLDAPHLKALSISGLAGESPLTQRLDILSNVLLRFSGIQYLKMKSFSNHRPEELVGLLRGLPSLVHLAVEISDFGDGILSQLSHSDPLTSDWLCPQLEEITLMCPCPRSNQLPDDKPKPEVTIERLYSMVQHRKQAYDSAMAIKPIIKLSLLNLSLRLNDIRPLQALVPQVVWRKAKLPELSR